MANTTPPMIWGAVKPPTLEQQRRSLLQSSAHSGGTLQWARDGADKMAGFDTRFAVKLRDFQYAVEELMEFAKDALEDES